MRNEGDLAMNDYSVVYRYWGFIEIKADSKEDARFKVHELNETSNLLHAHLDYRAIDIIEIDLIEDVNSHVTALIDQAISRWQSDQETRYERILADTHEIFDLLKEPGVKGVLQTMMASWELERSSLATMIRDINIIRKWLN
jgi:hypothetical protein